MSQDSNILAEAINLPGEVIMLPAREFAAIMDEIRRLGDLTKEHESRLNKHSEYITELRFKEEPEPSKTQANLGLALRALLASRQGKMLEKEARAILHLDRAVFSRLLKSQQEFIDTKPLHTDKRQNVLILRSKIS